MKKSLVLLALSGVALTACGGKSDGKTHSKEADGRCTSAFVNDYNNTNNALSNAETKRKRAGVTGSTYDMDQAKKAIAASHATCGAFFKAHSSVTCRAQALGTGAVTDVDSNGLKSGCEQVAKYHEILSSGVTGATPAGSGIAAPETSDAVDALPRSVEADGSCSDDFVRYYNTVFTRGQDLKRAVDQHRQTESSEDWTKVLDGLTKVVEICDQFESRHPDVTCKSASMHMAIGTEVTVATENHKEYCTSIRDIQSRAKELP